MLNNFRMEALFFPVDVDKISAPFLLTSPETHVTMTLMCPQCGLSFESRTQWNQFKLHLLYECQVTINFDLGVFKCPVKSCAFYSELASDFSAHWLNKHVTKQHQCELCEINGFIYVFDEEKAKSVAPKNGGPATNGSDNATSNEIPSSFLYNIINQPQQNGHLGENGASAAMRSADTPVISTQLLADINKHYFEKHRNEHVRLKVSYRCSCQDLCTESDFLRDSFVSDANVEANKNESNGTGEAAGSAMPDCWFSDWKDCKKHVLSFVTHHYTNFIKCLFCRKSILAENYQMHMRYAHVNEKDSFFICPICGFVKK
jgi:hypothetical protein